MPEEHYKNKIIWYCCLLNYQVKGIPVIIECNKEGKGLYLFA